MSDAEYDDDEVGDLEEEIQDDVSSKHGDTSDEEEEEAEEAESEQIDLDIGPEGTKLDRNIIHQVVIISDPTKRVTSEMFNRFEEADLIAIRAAQIDQNNPIFVDPEGITDSIEIARKELREGRCPLAIRRNIDDGRIFEEWSANELVGRKNDKK